MTLNQVKILYDGTKLFWRTQESVDLHIYLHDDEDVVEKTPGKSTILELVGFDNEKQKEYPRLYINFNVIFNHLQDKIKTQIMLNREQEFQKRVDYETMDTNFSLDTLSESEKTLLNTIICEYIVSKLSLQGLNPRVLAFGQHTEDLITGAMLRISNSKTKLPDLPNGTNSHSNNTQNGNTTNNAPPNEKLPKQVQDLLNTTVDINVPDNSIIDEILVLTIIKPVEIIRRRRTTEVERNNVINEIHNTAREASSFTKQATEFSRNTIVAVRPKTTLKTDSEEIDDVVAKYLAMMKEQSVEQDLDESLPSDSANANISTNGRARRHSTIVVIESEEDKKKQSYMRATAASRPDKLGLKDEFGIVVPVSTLERDDHGAVVRN